MDEDDRTSVWIKKISHVSPIAQPLASRKLTKRISKVVKKASKTKSLRKGVREVQKFIRRGEKGLVILAGDISPIDIYSHIPIMCEDKEISYCYVPSKDDLGAACGTIRPVSLVMINKNEEYEDLYTDLYEEVKTLPLPI
ncbi:H/ACA ribonucleoprotein complex subunit 2-like protein [Octopus bimaculoides]|uniref:H/ACA ribonucleoprotein complex subunit 2 n=1 Tax=Octopus bimaculoides TaxID=37653 RepID=A0A0L8FLP8_OCTBM|nr:H/ACA ribonucleoprotein complex subunit 2-like protein [Octopus bimaculoides]|eukprot:XP_014788722.1 PREDICTED: H/ACA ribonucleoprotein complex subunit 2-like protein [Octopus bimaculoides]